VTLKGAFIAGTFQIASGSNGFISWAASPLPVDLVDTHLDDPENIHTTTNYALDV